MQMSFPETVSDSLCRNYLVFTNRLLQQLSGCLVSDDLGGEDAGLEVLGWCGYTWSAVVRLRLDVLNCIFWHDWASE